MDDYGFQPDGGNSERPFVISRYPSRNSENDYLVEVKSRVNIFKKPGFFKVLSATLLLVAILLLIGFIILIILYTRSKPKICTSDECLRTATNLKFSIDFSVDPCKNFYQYTCGKWSEEHPNHGWWRSFSSFTTITERVAISSMNALTSQEFDPDAPLALTKSRDFYTSCMDQDSTDKMGLTPMYQYLKKAKLPIVPRILTQDALDQSNSTFNWMISETLLKQIFMMDVFIGFTVHSNIYNGSENVIYIGLIDQSCPLPSPLKSKKRLSRSKHSTEIKDRNTGNVDESTQLSREAHSNIMKYIFKEIAMDDFTLTVPNDEVLQKAADILIDISDVVDELVSNYTDPFQSEDDIKPITFKYLQAETDKILSSPQPNFWQTYFKYLFTGTDVKIDPDKDLLYITDLDLEYLYKILPFVLETPEIHVELYLWWSAIYSMIINTSSDVADYIDKQLSIFESSSTATVSRTKSLECALLVNNYMGYAVSYALADKSFPNTTKPKIERMVNELKQAFVDHLNGIQWMDAKTKKVTLEKSKEMLTFIGYPDWLFQEGKLDDYYDDVSIHPNTFLDNMMEVIISHNLQKMNSVREKHKRDWSSDPLEVNAYNSFSDNAINVPMAILIFPMYNLGLEVLNYGSIGAILGHELTHGFDNMGRKHDKYGNHVQWWSNQTIEIFENLTDCFVNQYNKFRIDGIERHIDGKTTLGENLADNGGLNQAFAAYKNRFHGHKDESKLPGFENFSSYQMFFIAYGSVWCETTTIKELENEIETDEHCPNSIRVLGTLQNSQDFADAFNCPVGSFMNPEKKCHIW